MPLLLLSINDKWAFTPEGCTDPWAYFGHYLNLPQHLNLFGESYVSNRLSVSLPGYLAYRFLPPLAANYALRLGLYYASVLSLYLIVRWTISPRAGLLAGLSLGCEFFFLRAIGWDYVDGFGISYFLLTAIALTAAARRPGWKCYLVAGGMGSSALVVANLFYVVFVPYLVLHYWYLNSQGRRNSLWRSFFLYALGAVALLLVFALFTWWVAGRFFFLSQSLHFGGHSIGSPNAWVEPVSTWLLGADWLVFAALTAVGSLIFIGSNRAQPRPTEQEHSTNSSSWLIAPSWLRANPLVSRSSSVPAMPACCCPPRSLRSPASWPRMSSCCLPDRFASSWSSLLSPC